MHSRIGPGATIETANTAPGTQREVVTAVTSSVASATEEKRGERQAKVEANGSIASFVVYVILNIDVGGKHFKGNGGGWFSFGAAMYGGSLFTGDLVRLFRDTVSFQVNSSGLYVNVNFFDRHAKLLGHLQSGGAGSVAGIGGGTGSWIS